MAPCGAAPPPATDAAREPLGEQGEITLSTFLMSLSTQALMYLGESPRSAAGTPPGRAASG